MDASPSDSSTSTRNPCSTAGLAHQAARAWPPSVAAPTLYHHQWLHPWHRPSPTTAARRQHQQRHSRCPRPGLRLLRPRAGTVDGGGERPPRTPFGAPTAGSSQGAGGGARAWRWRRPSMAAERTRRWRRQTAHRGHAAAPNRGGGAPGQRGNSGARRRHPGAAAAPKRRQRCPTRDPTAAVQGAGASP